MIYNSEHVEFEANLNEEESKWWKSRIEEFGTESQIVSRNPVEIESIKEIIEYLKIKGNQIFREAIRGDELAISVYQAYGMFHKRQEYASQALLEIAMNDYIRSKRFTLNVITTFLECPICESMNVMSNEDYGFHACMDCMLFF